MPNTYLMQLYIGSMIIVTEYSMQVLLACNLQHQPAQTMDACTGQHAIPLLTSKESLEVELLPIASPPKVPVLVPFLCRLPP